MRPDFSRGQRAVHAAATCYAYEHFVCSAAAIDLIYFTRRFHEKACSAYVRGFTTEG